MPPPGGDERPRGEGRGRPGRRPTATACAWASPPGMIPDLLFCFFQAEDGIRDVRDWSSDVCSSDLSADPSWRGGVPMQMKTTSAWRTASGRSDRKSVVEGKSVDLGGRRIIKKK